MQIILRFGDKYSEIATLFGRSAGGYESRACSSGERATVDRTSETWGGTGCNQSYNGNSYPLFEDKSNGTFLESLLLVPFDIMNTWSNNFSQEKKTKKKRIFLKITVVLFKREFLHLLRSPFLCIIFQDRD